MCESGAAEALYQAIVEGDEQAAIAAAEGLLGDGVSASEITAIMGRAMGAVGDLFQAYELFLPDIVVAADAFTQAMSRLEPALRAEGGGDRRLGRVALGVVAGDIHDIGKDIVRILLEAAGFEVKDLGRDVSPEQFVQAAREADIVAMSSLMSTTMGVMAQVVEALEEANLRGQVKVLVGGAPVSADFARSIGADGYGADAVEGVRVATAWMTEGGR